MIWGTDGGSFNFLRPARFIGTMDSHDHRDDAVFASHGEDSACELWHGHCAWRMLMVLIEA